MKKWLLLIVSMVLVFGAIFALKGAQIVSLLGFLQASEEAGLPPTPVATYVSEVAEWEDFLRFTGPLRPIQGVTLKAEVGGEVSGIFVENGAEVEDGKLLLEIDAREERAELASAQAKLRLAELNLERTKGLLAKKIIAQSEFDAAKAEFDDAAAIVENLKAMIAKKSIGAPFAGQVGIRLVNLGQTVAPGDDLLPLHSSDPIYVEFAVPQTRLSRIAVWQTLRVATDGLEQPLEGTVTAINPVVDEASRTARVQGTLANPDRVLRPGQFVTVDVVFPEKRKVTAIPSSAVVAAAYGDSVFVVEEQDGQMVARQQFVRLGSQRGDFVSVEKGLEPGERVVSAGAFKLSNGAPVTLDDPMQPEPQLNPDPGNS